MPASLDLIGRGWAFPLGVDARGGIALAEGDEEIRQAILLIVRTRRGARVMRPEFGCRIWELPVRAERFVDLDDGRPSRARGARLVGAAHRGRGRPGAAGSRATRRPCEVEVDYTIRATHDRRSLVFPFYLIPDEPAAAAAKVAETAQAMAEPGNVPAKAPVAAGAFRPQVATGRAPEPSSRSAGPKEASR